jgi:predicted transcriptional regulator
MNLDEAINDWKRRLADGEPLYRVRVRRLLEMDGAERRGIAIMRRIADKFERNGLKTVPDFQSAWIDALVSIELSNDGSNSGTTIGAGHQSIVSSPGTDSTNVSPVDPDLAGGGERSLDTMTAPLAEALNSPVGDAGVVEVAAAVVPTIDAIIRISSIRSANLGVVSVLPTDLISKATTLMSFEGYSQLAIMQGHREVRGMITWESIARRSMLTPAPTIVADCRVDAQVIDSDASLFDAFPTIEKFGYVLARSKERTITGIVTSTDYAAELGQHSYAFMCLRTIEMLIRKKLHPQIVPLDLANLEEYSRARTESDPDLLTFGENVRLLERDEIWGRLNIIIDKSEFTKRLHDIRDVRNEVMHFGPDPLGDDQKKSLKQMEDFLRQVFV